MNKCKRCNVTILDETPKCPLCDMVLSGDGEGQEDSYPDVINKTRIYKRIVDIISYFAVVLEIILIVINYYNYYGIKWSAITGGALVYLIFTLHYTASRRDGHIKKIFMQTLGALALIIFIDFANGFSGWSINIGIPAVILLLDIIILVCMIINHKNWQSYLLMQVFTVLLSILYMVLYLLGKVGGPVLPWVSFGVSAIMFTSCLVIGDKKAKSELKRRFYI